MSSFQRIKLVLILISVFGLHSLFGGDTVSFMVNDDWQSGFTAGMNVTNTTGQALSNWTLEFDFEHEITNIWNAEIVTHTGNHYVIKNAAWNGSLAANAQISFGFNGKPGNVIAPNNYKFNGKPVDDGGVEPEPDLLTAVNDTATLDQDSSVSLSILSNDIIPETADLKEVTLTQPSHGTASYNYAVALVTYTPSTGYSGQDSFQYTLSTTAGASATATVTLTVTPKQQAEPPPAPTLSILKDWENGGYNISWTKWSGATATSWHLYENGNLIHSENLPTSSDEKQTGSFHISNRPYGVYGYEVALQNQAGTSKSALKYYAVDGASYINIAELDTNRQAIQLTLGLSEEKALTLENLTNSNSSFSLSSNNKTVFSYQTGNNGTLTLKGLKAGRASLKIKDLSTSETRFIGIRVKKSDGTLPALPDYLSIGSVSEDSQGDLAFWQDFHDDLKNKRMDIRYIYINGGPKNQGVGWRTWTQRDGFRVTSFIRESIKLGMIPFLVYYNIPDGGESYFTDKAHIQNPDYMRGYFDDLKFALELVKAEAGDELVGFLLEPDFIGYFAQNDGSPDSVYAYTQAAYESGILDESQDPTHANTLTGLVKSINCAIRKHLPTAYLGWQFNLWASPAGGFTTSPPAKGIIRLTDTFGIENGREMIRNEAAAITDYYISAGVLSYDANFVSIDKYGLDGGFEGKNDDPAQSTWLWNAVHWTNYLQFVKTMHQKTKLPVILWQLPVGHINSSQMQSPYTGQRFPDLDNSSRHYEDSGPTYFFGDTFTTSGQRLTYFSQSDSDLTKVNVDTTSITWQSHLPLARDCGVQAILFGAGVGSSTDSVGSPPTDDYWWMTKAQHYYANPVMLDGQSGNDGSGDSGSGDSGSGDSGIPNGNVTFTITNDWGSGFCADMTVTYTGSETLNGWTLEFDYPYEISNIWNVELVEQSGTHYKLKNLSWNAVLNPNSKIAFGFCASPGNATGTPTNITLNGSPIDNGGNDNGNDDNGGGDTPPDPVTVSISVSNIVVTEPDEYTPASGYFHTEGNQIVDGNGTPVRLAGVNWFGLETPNFAPHGLWSRNYKAMMDQMKSLGFNCIRLPYCNALLEESNQPNGIDFHLNPGLQDKTGLEVMDCIIDYAEVIGLKIILDRHRSSAGSGPNGSGLWYTDTYPESVWISDWEFLAARYRDTASVIGADLHNEPHASATWGSGDLATDWRLAAERAGNAILRVNPDWLIFVEGIEFHDGKNYWWGGNLSAAADHPIRLNQPGKLVYSPHAYPSCVFEQTWFTAPDYPNNLPAKWDEMWGYIYKTDMAPVLIGEFGTTLEDPRDRQWVEQLTTYMNELLASDDQGVSWTWWSWNPNSGDTGGILKNDWQTIEQEKLDLITKIQQPLPSISQQSGTGQPVPELKEATFTVSLSEAATSVISVDYQTTGGNAIADSDYLAANGTLTFQPGETSKTVVVTILGDTIPESTESFTLSLTNAVGADLSQSQAECTILDNDSSTPPDQESTYKVIGYYPNWAMYRTPAFKPESIDATKLTHINYAFAKVDKQGNVLLIDSWADIDYRSDWNSTEPYYGNFLQLKKLKEQHPHLKVMISIGGWTLSDNFSAMAENSTTRANFVKRCIEFCETYDCFDGVDIDWEYPGFEDHSGRPQDKTNFTLLLQELHTAFKNHPRQFLLSIAAPAGSWHYQNMELDKIHHYLDWVNLMTYDMHGPWGGTEDAVTNHQSGLYATSQGNPQLTIAHVVKHYLSQGIPSNKLVVGMPLYGRSYSNASQTTDGLFSLYSGTGSGTTSEKGVRFFSDIKNNLLTRYTRYWDSAAQVPYLYDERADSETMFEFITYDDEESIAIKCDYIKNNKLGGGMVWELGLDTWQNNWDIMTVLQEALLK